MVIVWLVFRFVAFSKRSNKVKDKNIRELKDECKLKKTEPSINTLVDIHSVQKRFKKEQRHNLFKHHQTHHGAQKSITVGLEFFPISDKGVLERSMLTNNWMGVTGCVH